MIAAACPISRLRFADRFGTLPPEPGRAVPLEAFGLMPRPLLGRHPSGMPAFFLSVSPGKSSPVWRSGGALGLNRHLVKNTPHVR